ncbi:MAG TPA: cysteine peptidase family C39 domain-containing protein [Rectinemataceae bacterium]
MKALALLALLAELADGEAFRFSYCAEQEYDSSCGLSALASLMAMYWNIPVDERILLGEIAPRKASSGDYSISFADMGSVLESRGFAWRAFRMNPDQLERAMESHAPLILHFDWPLGHFVLALGFCDGRFVIADPARGVYAICREALLGKWSGYALAALHPGRTRNQALLDQARADSIGRLMILENSARVSGFAAPK